MKRKVICLQRFIIITLILFAGMNMIPVKAEDETVISMYRMYNPYSGEHLYTQNYGERDTLLMAGWNYEGIAWTSPAQGTPVYRLYNPYSGEHHYTLDTNERDVLASIGWNLEGISFCSDDAQRVPVYRLFNPYSGWHHYTLDAHEYAVLPGQGWRQEGVCWYASGRSRDIVEHPVTVYDGVDYAAVYDYAYYVNNNPDIYAAYGNDDAAVLRHYALYGIGEGRQAKEGIDPQGEQVITFALKYAGDRARNILNSVSGNGIFAINGYRLDEDIRNALQNGINNVGTECAFVMMDLASGKGVGYNIDSVFYSASSVKGPYMASISKYANADAVHADLVQRVLYYSDNYAYSQLFNMYGVSYLRRWYNESNVPADNLDLYVDYSARDLARLWTTMYTYFQNDAHGASFSGLYTRPNISPIHTNLGSMYTTKTKAGWYGYDARYNAVNDAGIVYAGNRPYLLVVMSRIDNYGYSRLNSLVQALNAAHDRI